MPILNDFRRTKTITLPSYPDSKVEIYDAILVGDAAEFIGEKQKDGIANSLAMLPKFIKSWNFTDEKEQPLPINRENLNFLKQPDVEFLIKELTAFIEEGKKK